MEDVVIIEKILRSMTPKYDYVVCSIEESNDLDTLSIDELQSSLLVHEQRISHHTTDEQALQITHWTSTRRKRWRWNWDDSHKETILADLEWEEDQDAGTNGSLREETEANITSEDELENMGFVQSDSLEEGESSNDGSPLYGGRVRRPPGWMQDYVTGQGLSDEENVDMAHLALFSESDPLTYEVTLGAQSPSA
ncbi:hypothetical protein F0562_031818 [Nyssa sinensis]|uniref:Uncharacterized protein n=1 Tax=Nyssa sinensis TaxID=561372 RepID=A0A5J5AZ97_9ASTE|nr:hypothetical protein F0562_031818 [Nyssa sinensis]